LASPLTDLTKKDAKFQWTEVHENAFVKLKEKLITAPILTYPLEGCPLELHTDASDYAVGSVLVQIENGTERVLGYASRKLSSSELKYSVSEKECIAIIHGINYFRPFIYGKVFTVVTDHIVLICLYIIKYLNS